MSLFYATSTPQKEERAGYNVRKLLDLSGLIGCFRLWVGVTFDAEKF